MCTVLFFYIDDPDVQRGSKVSYVDVVGSIGSGVVGFNITSLQIYSIIIPSTTRGSKMVYLRLPFWKV